MTTVSVLLPTLNRRALVMRAVESVLAQTHPDFELVIVDGGSSDGTHGALEPLLGERVRLLTVPGIGVSAARNEALRNSTGPIVAFLDSDNVWRREHLTIVSALLDRHPEAVLASTGPRYEVAGRAGLDSAQVEDPLPRIFVGSDVGWTSGIAVRREPLEAVGGFDERLVVWEDADLWRRLALQGCFVYLRRRTVTIQRTVGSLSDRARDQGLQFEALELSTTRLVDEVERFGRPELRDPALGSAHWARALRATAAGDEEETRAELAEGTRLLPDLARDSDLALAMVRWFFPRALGTRKRLRALQILAGAWPDQGAESAVRLRVAATVAALRAGRPVAALALLTGLRPVPTARLVLRLAFGTPYHLRRLLAARVHRGRESAHVRAGVDVAQDQRTGADGR
jgi:hypothetical protein